jgi:hypothetical protein
MQYEELNFTAVSEEFKNSYMNYTSYTYLRYMCTNWLEVQIERKTVSKCISTAFIQ